jgi:tRNA uridine 5-carboxymethylaminomethyl modification enzyme
MFHVKHFDVIVIGGGHAGTEAAAAAARMGASTALISLRRAGIGVMSCNPAIGGLGKGHLVREIDALDGVMARAADRAGIQFRLLNRRKGPAVQGPRAQTDRKLYREAIQELLAKEENLTVIEGEVTGLTLDAGRFSGVELSDGSSISGQSGILTAGTFLHGLIHIGTSRTSGGRMGDLPSIKLADQMADLGLKTGRLKTGTPPRLDGKTIDWSRTEEQPGDDEPSLFSFMSAGPVVRQVSCGVTHTNEATHEIIRKNIHLSAMYGGHIEGVGPRYCPSIEDKVVRFADKTSHQIFLEPEGLDDDTIYPNGISSSLPLEVQEAYVRSIVGLENVKILQPAYAIEYDFFDPRDLTQTLMTRDLEGLFFAGQINGTTGYEEAAAQGLVAGLNAASYARGGEKILFGRADSYIGVLIDDLIHRGVTEPYRMFTSRAEFRLALRADNADQRLTPIGVGLGCVRPDRMAAFEQKITALEAGREILSNSSFSPKELRTAGINVNMDSGRRTLLRLLSMPEVTREQINALQPEAATIDPAIRTQIENDALYQQYLDRQENDIAAMRREEETLIPPDLEYRGLPGLSGELAGKLFLRRPETLAQASRIEGMTPAALALILAHIKKARRAAAGR